jgi:hypothetical protein
MHEYYQVLLLSAVFAAYLCAVLWVRPFKGFMQHVQVFVAAVLLGTCLCILALIPPEGLDSRQQGIMQKTHVAIGYVIIIGNGLCAGGLVLLMLLAMGGRCGGQPDDSDSSFAGKDIMVQSSAAQQQQGQQQGQQGQQPQQQGQPPQHQQQPSQLLPTPKQASRHAAV